ncbi:MAG TPA: hypothetical protein VMI73_07310 [Trebonia sp.]|nr:hypothetical protein [Trebonia sp.]
MAAAEVAVLAFADALGLDEAPVLAAAEEELEPVAAGVLLVELELLHPAASRIDPTAAAAATIAFDARKVTLPCPPGLNRASVGILARQVSILANAVERKVANS